MDLNEGHSTAKDLFTGEVRQIASSQVIYVALDENRKPSPVPPLVPADAEEAAIIEKARLRRMYMQKINEKLAQQQDTYDKD